MAAHVVGFDEVHTPGCIQFSNGIVVRLRAGLGRVHTPHIGIPAAVIVFVGDIAGVISRAFDRRVLFNRLPRNAAHDVNSKFQAFAVDVIGERLESLAVGRGGKAIHGGQQAAVFIHRQLRAGSVIVALGVRLVPLNIDDNKLPAMARQIARHCVSIGFHLCFSDPCAVAIPAVPAHGRGGCGSLSDRRRDGEQRGEQLQHET